MTIVLGDDPHIDESATPPQPPPSPSPGDRQPPPPPPPAASRDRPRRQARLDSTALSEFLGCLISSGALAWLIFFRLTPLFGAMGIVLAWYALFVPMYWLVVRAGHGKLAARDRMATVVVTTGAILTVIPLVLIITFVVAKGLEGLSMNFFTETLEFTGPDAPPTEGGAAHAIVGTLEQVAIAIAISVPLGVLTAVYLNEIGGRFARVVRVFVDAMSGLPSIVAGLFIYAIWILQLEQGFSGFAAALALAVLMLPTITRTTEEMLRLVPDGLREASLALGAPEWKTTTKVVLPTARTGIVTAVILGTARAVGETAPVLLTAFGAFTMNWNPFSEPQANMPLYVWNLVRSSQDTQVARAWTGAMMLILLVLFLFVLARIIGGSQFRTSGRGFWGPLAGPLRRSPKGPSDELTELEIEEMQAQERNR